MVFPDDEYEMLGTFPSINVSPQIKAKAHKWTQGSDIFMELHHELAARKWNQGSTGNAFKD